MRPAPRDAHLGRERALIEASTLTRTFRLPRSRRFLATLGDDRLAVAAQLGNEVALEVIYDRHHRGLLSFCRHILGSREDAEDALQQVFASAFRALAGDEKPIQLKPWLYTIARNRCLTMLRARREHPVEEVEGGGSTVGLSEEVERRAELRELVTDLQRLPERQKTALVLSEMGALDHSEVAQVLDCGAQQVKSLVFQARSTLIKERQAREIACADIREQLATATARDLRRGELRRHLRQCDGCAEFHDEVRRQRGMLALALPVVPTVGLKESALAAAGIGGGGAAGGGGLIAALGASGAAKVTAAGIAVSGAAGGIVAADPGLVSRAQAAVEQAADDVGSLVSGPSGGARDGEGTVAKVSGSFDWEAAKRAARDKSRADAKSRREGSPGRGDPSGVGDGKGQGGGRAGNGQRGDGHPGKARGQGAGGSGAKGGRGRGSGPPASSGQGKGGGGDGAGGTPRGGRGRRVKLRPGLPDAGNGGGGRLGPLPGGGDGGAPLKPKEPRGLSDRGESPRRF